MRLIIILLLCLVIRLCFAQDIIEPVSETPVVVEKPKDIDWSNIQGSAEWTLVYESPLKKKMREEGFYIKEHPKKVYLIKDKDNNFIISDKEGFEKKIEIKEHADVGREGTPTE